VSRSKITGMQAMSLWTHVTVRPMMRIKEITIDVLVKNALVSENSGAMITYIAAFAWSSGLLISMMCWPNPYFVPTVTVLVQAIAKPYNPG